MFVDIVEEVEPDVYFLKLYYVTRRLPIYDSRGMHVTDLTNPIYNLCYILFYILYHTDITL